jgi:hypothetical protein
MLLLLRLLLRGHVPRGLKPLQQLGRRPAQLLSRQAFSVAAGLFPLLLCWRRVRAAGRSQGLSDCRLQRGHDLGHPSGARECAAQVTGLRDCNHLKGVQYMRARFIHWTAEPFSNEIINHGAPQQTAQRLRGTCHQFWVACRQQAQLAA